MRRLTWLSFLFLLQACAPRAVDRAAVEEDIDAAVKPVDAAVKVDTAAVPDTAPPVDARVVDTAVPVDTRPPDTMPPDMAVVVDSMPVDTLPRDTAPPDTMPATKKVLLVVSDSAALLPGDVIIKNRLDGRMYTVTAVSSTAIAATDVTGKDLVVVSSSASSMATAPRTALLTAKVPVVCMEPAYYDDLKMTGATDNTDFGAITAQNDISILAATHALAAGLTGTVSTMIAGKTHSMAWGVPATAATKVASIPNMANQVVIFGYAADAMMVGQTAPARRVGFFCSENTFADLSANGLKLLDAAIDWALGLK